VVDFSSSYFRQVCEGEEKTFIDQSILVSISTQHSITSNSHVSGVEYLFLNKIIHGDIKVSVATGECLMTSSPKKPTALLYPPQPQNLLLADGDIVKVADLGVCNEFLGEDAQIDQRTASGTPAFRAPETLSGQNVYFDGKKADIW
jgi:serine/threonine protein kinase